MNIEVRSNPTQSNGFLPGSRLEQLRSVFENSDSVSFDQLLKPNTKSLTPSGSSQGEYTPLFEIDSFLVLATHLAKAIQEIHHQHVVHGSIHPALISLELCQVETAYDIRSNILDPILVQGQQLSERLAYLSPEQTGRINHPIDHRTDLYALGVIFYQTLIGRLPFLVQEPLELIHAHIATTPTPPAEIYSHIPSPLSNIVLKLLAKDPRDRYQSATGLWLDLEKCLTEWRTSGHVEPFVLGQGDIAERLLLPEKLYGRQKELEYLVHTFDDVLESDSRLLLLTGESGVGKTRLIGELLEPVATRGGILLTYLVESEQENIPFAAAIGLLKNFVQQLLAKEPAQIVVWQERLAAALAGRITILTKHIPELGLLVEIPSDTHSEVSDPQLLLNMALANFWTAIAAAGEPLVLVVDDAHKADAYSLHLLRNLTLNTAHILIIWAYRSDVVTPSFLQTTIAILPGEYQLHLSPFDFATTCHFLTETLYTTTEQVHELAQLIHTKSNGNPFFVREMVRSLHGQGFITFDFQQRTWHWDLAQIQAMPIADNVAALVQARLQRLTEPVQKMLKIAAFMGSRFELDSLATILELTPTAANQIIKEALSLGVITHLVATSLTHLSVVPLTEPRAEAMRQLSVRYFTRELPPEKNTPKQPISSQVYQFTHEQIRIAAAYLLPTLSAESIHGQIGWQLWRHLTPTQRQAKCVWLVHHLNQTPVQQAAWPDRVSVAQVNLQASREVLVQAAAQNALSFAQAGMTWLGEGNGWREAYSLMRDLCLTAAQAATRLGQFQQTDRLLNEVEQQATSTLDRVAAAEERMLSLYLQGKHEAAVAAARVVLQQLGIYLPQKPGRRHIILALLRVQMALLRKPLHHLAALPPISDPYKIKAMEIMAAATIAVASVNPNFLMLIGLEMMRQTIQYGTHPLSAIGYALYGVLLCGVLGQIKWGYTFGQFALSLMPQIMIKEYRVFVKYFVHAHINHWQDHIQTTLQPLRDSSATGEFEYFAVAAGLYPYFTWFISGMDLTASERAIAENMYLLEPFRDTPIYYRYQMGQQYYRNLLGLPHDPSQMVGAAYDEQRLLPVHLSENDHTTIFYLACHKLTLCYLFGAYEQAIPVAQLAIAHNQGGIGTPLIPVLYFYDSLARLALIPSISDKAAKQHLNTVMSNQRKLRRWAHHSPANCLHRYSLVAAEQARVRGEYGQARELYDTAIRQAQTHNYLPELAVAHEAAAQFYLNLKQSAYAEYHLRQSYQQYQTWGALGKLRQIEHRFPHLFSNNPAADTGPFAGLSAHLDMTTVLKAAQILSRETDLARLIATLTAILIENAGAQYGALLLPEGNQWRVVSHQPAEEREKIQTVVAMSLVWQVTRTREPILLNDVAAAATLTYDPHLQQAHPRSLLCLPLLNEGELVAVLYLENRLTRHAFPPERLPLLTMLAGQAAISLKNARLVAGLQEARATIQASEQRFRLLFENAPLGILEIDIAAAPPQILTVNRRAEALYGWSAPEFAALDPALLTPKASRQEIQRLIETVRAGKTATLESFNQRRDGTIFPVRIIATPAPQQGGLHMIVAVEDITAQQQRRSEVAAIEEERRRIAQEIHDGVAQNLAFLRLKMALWHDWVVSDPERTQMELQQTQILLDETIAEIRHSIYALRPLALDTMGLLPVLRRYVADFNEQHKVYITLQIDILEEQLSPDHELLLFRVIQEALSNIAQHAQASLAWVKLETKDENTVILTIRDNGRGFNTANLTEIGRSGHLGLLQMQERVEQAGGQTVVSSQPNQGTEIQIKLPLL